MSCSFCYSNSHNIRNCQDPMIHEIYERMKVIYIDINNQYPYAVESTFKTVLNRRFNLRELRAICATYTDYPSSISKQPIIHLLYQYFRSHILLQEERPLFGISGLPTHPDPIPDFARDLNEPLSLEEDDNINWTIDRTPSPISMIRTLETPPPINRNRRNINRLSSVYLTRDAYIEYALSGLDINLLSYFNNITQLRTKKYNINPVLVTESIEGTEDCAICYESVKTQNMVQLNCEHRFCGLCIKETLKTHNKICGPSCALCRTQMNSFYIKNPEIYNLIAEHCNL